MRIKEIRLSRNIQQKTLASELGIRQNTLSQYETGAREPDLKMLCKIADKLDVSVAYLLGHEEKQKKPTPTNEDGLDPELIALIKRIPADRMPEVERYLRFQAEQKEKP